MLIEEARWLGVKLRELGADNLYPMCNIGSSTAEFREVVQPYIHSYLFATAAAQGRKIVHVDMKAAPGVDCVGDLLDPKFFAALRDNRFRSVMCCNLLEHVTNPNELCRALATLVDPGGYIIVTVPRLFPYHEDPIDTMFRPAVADLIALFPGTEVWKSKIVRASRFAYEMRRDYRVLCWLLVRVAIPFYRPHNWMAAVQRLGDLIVGYRVTCVVFRRQAARS